MSEVTLSPYRPPKRRPRSHAAGRLALCAGALLFAAGALWAQPQAPAALQAQALAHARRLHRVEPWAPRHRPGLVLEPPAPASALATDAGAHGPLLSMQEARRLGLRPRGRGALPSEPWPPEPPSPAPVSGEGFARALSELCPAGSDAAALSALLLDASVHFGVDPFLLAALVYHQSRCDPARDDAYGIGLARISPVMFQAQIEHGVLHYGHPNGRGGYYRAQLPVERFAFTPRALRHPGPNVYFAAALLRVFEQQCPAIDTAFESVPHRSPVSHFVWGDHVRGEFPEDQILTARRRLLFYYAPYSSAPGGHLGGTAFSSPLDGAPRLVIGVMGDPRDGGKRKHAGIDLAAAEGEPVRAVAPGVISFAGVDLREHGLIAMDPEHAHSEPPGAMGPRGVFVRVRHPGGLESLYAHLSGYRVRTGQNVRRGELIGWVGRTGVHASAAHLHFGLFLGLQALDPLPALRPYVLRATGTEAHARAPWPRGVR